MTIEFLESYKSNCMGQGYDGPQSWVAATIKAEAENALYVHCSCLKLIFVDTVKSLPEADSFCSLLCVHVWILCAPEEAECSKGDVWWLPQELQKLSDTRWTWRVLARRNLMGRLPAMLCVLQILSKENLRDGPVMLEACFLRLTSSLLAFLQPYRNCLETQSWGLTRYSRPQVI